MAQVLGTDGDDILHGSPGDDTIDGGMGHDTVSYADATGSVTVDLSAATSAADGPQGHDTLVSIDGVIGSAFDDVITGQNAYEENTIVASAGLGGVNSNGNSYRPVVSPDGHYVLFSSFASNVLPGDADGGANNDLLGQDLVLKNLQTGEVTRINCDADGNIVPADREDHNFDAQTYLFSADGKSVYFSSVLFPEDHNLDPTQTIYRKDLTTGALTAVATATGSEWYDLHVSADGGTLYFEQNFQGPYNRAKVFALDIATGQKTILSDDPNDYWIGGANYSISADGQWIAFIGATDNRTGQGLSSERTDIILKNLWTGQAQLLGHNDAYYSLQYAAAGPQVSADGTKVLFVTETPYLTDDDNSNDIDIFIMDIASGKLTRLPYDVKLVNWEANPPHFVGDTHLVAFAGYDQTVSGANQPDFLDLMIYDPESGVIHTAAYDMVWAGLNTADHFGVSFSADGSVAAVNQLENANLAPGNLFRNDGNGFSDVVAFDPRLPISVAGDDRLSGGDGNDVLSGLGGKDTLDGGKGNDRLDGGAGNDILIGAAGDDTYVFNSINSSLGYGLMSGVDTISDSGGEDTIRVSGGVNEYGYNFEISGNDLYISFSGIGLPASSAENHILVIDGVLNPIEHLVFDDSVAGQHNVGDAANQTLTGGAGSDTLDGGGGVDIMYGGAASDIYYVDNAADLASEETVAGTDDGGVRDIVFASASYALADYIEDLYLTGSGNLNGTGNGSDNLIGGGGGANVLSGGGGKDYIIAGAGNDTLLGGEGDDTLRGGAGRDHIDGGDGFDMADYSASTSAVTVYLDNSAAGTAEAEGDMFVSIEAVMGTAYDDKLYGTAAPDNLDGGAGNDYLVGGASGLPAQATGPWTSDILRGGAGDDILEGGAGADLMDGGAGTDTLSYRHAGMGIRIDQAGNDPNNIWGDPADESTLDSFSNIEIWWGSDFADDVQVTSGQVFGFAGNDVISTFNGGSYLDGGAGDDTLNGHYGDATMVGGTGNDRFYVGNFKDVVTELAGEGTDTVYSYLDYTLGANIENLVQMNARTVGHGNAGDNILSSQGTKANLYGEAGNDTLIGTNGRDYLNGGDGNDTLNGGADGDTMVGGAGNDTYHVDHNKDIVTELHGGGSDTVISNRAYTLGAEVEKLTLTGTGNLAGTGNALNNTLIGNDGSNKLSGDDGSDILSGGLGGDTLDGGKGADLMKGGQGDDRYYVDNKLDSVTEYSGQGNDTVLINGTYTLGLNVENLIFTGAGDRFGTGNALDNHLTGNKGDNTLGGADGNDIIDGGAGADRMRGGNGDDIFYVDNAGDTVTEYTGQGTDSVVSSVAFTLGNNVENLTLSGAGNVNGIGNTRDNILVGNSGKNRLDGGHGHDSLTGGLGADTFVFGLDSGADTVSDFSASQNDRINLSAYHAQATAIIAQIGNDAVIDLGGGNVVTVANTSAVDAAFLSHIVW